MGMTEKRTQIANGLLLVLAIAAVAGIVVHYGQPHNHTSDVASDGHAHSHDTYYSVSTEQAPTVSFDISPDPLGGFNVHIQTQRFTWAPEHVNGAPVLGEGHAHIYVDGEKINRVYGPWYKLPSLAPGEHVVRVTLNANDHSVYAVNGHPVATSTTVIVAE